MLCWQIAVIMIILLSLYNNHINNILNIIQQQIIGLQEQSRLLNEHKYRTYILNKRSQDKEESRKQQIAEVIIIIKIMIIHIIIIQVNFNTTFNIQYSIFKLILLNYTETRN